MKKAILDWLLKHPDWILRTEYLNKITQYDLEKNILDIYEFGFITKDGQFYSSLRDIPNFIGVKQVIRINTISDEKENMIVLKELENLFDIHLIDEKIDIKQNIINKAKTYIAECEMRKKQLKFEEENQIKLSI